MNERLAFDKPNLAVACTFQEPQVTITPNVDQTFVVSTAALEVHENGWRYFIPIPGFIGIVLKVAPDFSSRHIDCDCRRSIEVIAGPLVSHPRTTVARADEN